MHFFLGALRVKMYYSSWLLFLSSANSAHPDEMCISSAYTLFANVLLLGVSMNTKASK